MFMGNIHRLEGTIIKVSALLNLIYKSNIVQMKIPIKFFVVFDKLILILMLKTKNQKRKRATKIVKRYNKG